MGTALPYSITFFIPSTLFFIITRLSSRPLHLFRCLPRPVLLSLDVSHFIISLCNIPIICCYSALPANLFTTTYLFLPLVLQVRTRSHSFFWLSVILCYITCVYILDFSLGGFSG